MTLVSESFLEGLRVLVVDDDAETRDAIVALLAHAGATTHAAASMRDALEAVATWHPDVLVSDVCMPDGDGFALIRQVRARSEADGGAVAAVALTGISSVDAGRDLVAAGFQCSLKKPVDPDTLLTALTTVACSRTATLVGSEAKERRSRRNGDGEGTRHGALGADASACSPTDLTHDLRQPLFAMRIWLRLLENEIGGTVSDEGRSHLAQLRGAITWMSDLLGRDVDP